MHPLLPRFAFALGCLFFAYAFLLRVSPGVMVTELMREFAVGAAVLGNLSAFYLYVYAGIQIPVGVLLDRFGPRRLMTAACVLAALGAWLFAQADSLATAYAGRLLIGAGCAFSFPATLAIVYQWFPRRFATLGGVTQSVGMAGAVFGQAPLAAAVTASGWRNAIAALALAGLALAVMMWLTVRDRARASGPRSAVGTGLQRVLANRQTWFAAVYGLALSCPILAFGGLWGVPFLGVAYDLDRTSAAGIVSLLFVGAGVSAPLVGWWSDRMGRRRPAMIVAALVAAISQCLVLGIPGLPLWLLSVLVFVIGTGGGGLILSFAAGREHNAMNSAGVAVGVVNMLMVGSGALFQPLIGLLLDLSWDGVVSDGVRAYTDSGFRLALAVLPAASVVGVASAVLLGETWCHQQGDSNAEQKNAPAQRRRGGRG